MYVYMGTHVCRPLASVRCLLFFMSIHLERTSLTVIYNLLSKIGHQASGISTPQWGLITAYATIPRFLHVFWALNSDVHAYEERIFD